MTNATIQAWIAYLRCEAAQSEERAKSLRATAAVIEANNNYGEATKRKRKRDTSKPKRAHTAYTLFVQENYELNKKNNRGNEMASKDLLSIVARQWAETSAEDKELWKIRVDELREAESGGGTANVNETVNDDGLPDLPTTSDEGKKPAAKKSTRGKASSISV